MYGSLFEAALSLVKDTLLAEMEAGKIKKVPLPMVFLTFYSLLTYPFLVRNLITTLFLDNEEDFTSFLQEWKQHIITELTNLLSNDK